MAISKSAISRRFVVAAEAALAELMSRRLDVPGVVGPCGAGRQVNGAAGPLAARVGHYTRRGCFG